MIHGARLVIKTLAEIAENTIKPQAQTYLLKPGESAKLAPKINPNFCIIDWNNDPVKTDNFIRGLSPYPCARTFFKNSTSCHSVKIFEAQPEMEIHGYKNGQIVSDGNHFIRIACNGGLLNITSLQLEGKKRMNTIEFLRGFRIDDYTSC
jgi:methionyl-tRNA formyltransferase